MPNGKQGTGAKSYYDLTYSGFYFIQVLVEGKMGKHSIQQVSYWEARRRGRDLRKRADAKSKAPGHARKRKLYWFAIFFAVGLVAGATLGFYIRPIAKLGAKMYLALKEKQWQTEGAEKKEVKTALTSLSADPGQSVNTLVMGSDAGSNKGEGGWCRSDVMMLICLQERDKRAIVISIPRDTRIELPGHGTNKINAAHAFGGPSSAIDAAKSLLGIDVHHYISMNFDGFKKIINAIGGVPIHLNKPINDPHSGRLPQGDLLLDGEQALIVVRSRKLPGGDIDRIQNQQAFLKALMTKAESMKSAWKAKRLVDIVASTCKMDYAAGQLTNLAEELRGFKIENVQFVTVPGDSRMISGVSYFVADMPLLAQVTLEVKANTLISPELKAKLQAPVTRRVEELNGPDADAISVLSGWKTSTWAVPTVAQELRLFGHDKVFEGQSKQPLARTTVYFRHEAKEACKKIKESVPELGNADVVLNDQIPVQYNSPVVIVLGQDFKTSNLVSIYGRICQPAFNFQNLGRKVVFFD